MEGRLPQMDKLTDLRHHGATEEAMPEEAARIRVSNNQHPDHDTRDWRPKG
jgi:hypothetical protein